MGLVIEYERAKHVVEGISLAARRICWRDPPNQANYRGTSGSRCCSCTCHCVIWSSHAPCRKLGIEWLMKFLVDYFLFDHIHVCQHSRTCVTSSNAPAREVDNRRNQGSRRDRALLRNITTVDICRSSGKFRFLRRNVSPQSFSVDAGNYQWRTIGVLFSSSFTQARWLDRRSISSSVKFISNGKSFLSDFHSSGSLLNNEQKENVTVRQ